MIHVNKWRTRKNGVNEVVSSDAPAQDQDESVQDPPPEKSEKNGKTEVLKPEDDEATDSEKEVVQNVDTEPTKTPKPSSAAPEPVEESEPETSTKKPDEKPFLAPRNPSRSKAKQDIAAPYSPELGEEMETDDVDEEIVVKAPEDEKMDTTDSKEEEEEDSVPSKTEKTPKKSKDPAPTSSRRDSYNKNTYIMLDVNHKKVEPKDIIEYEWPIKSGDRWFLQEQIGELLNIKSFSRKYPQLCRRKVNSEEREFLERIYNVHKLLNETSLRDMIAMRASEIHDMMQSDFLEVYTEYKKVVGQREKEIQLKKAEEMGAIKNDAARYEALRKASLQSAVEFNKDLQSRRRSERAHFWDIQTNIIQSPRNKWKIMKPEATRPGPYPVAVIQGQYQSYYKTFTPEELHRLPLGTVMDSSYLFPPVREPSPPPLNIAAHDLIRQEKEEALKGRESTLNLTPRTSTQLESVYTPPPMDPKRKCDSCEKLGGEMIRCSICEIVYHPACIEMPDRMVRIVKTYEWVCVDCRVCSVCEKPEKEDHVVFCDSCDRGFHWYCVGLKGMPRGGWMCQNYCSSTQLRAFAKRTMSANMPSTSYS
uniref:PHD finger protein 10 n=1 Tax=Caenorhabditis tropicalis TaxID=1561998 RepID=A0A1I7TLS5_9PELO